MSKAVVAGLTVILAVILISTFGVTDRSARSQSLVVNLGETDIWPGDLVAMVGVTTSPEYGQPMLAVAKVDASNRNAVIGVAALGFSAETVTFEDGSTSIDFTPHADVIAPGSYLAMITDGLAPAVNVSSLALVSNGVIGDKIVVSAEGELALAEPTVDQIVVGKMAGPVDVTTGTIPLFIDID